MPPRSSSPICERSLDLTLIGIGRRDIPQCSLKHFLMQMLYRTFSSGQRPRLCKEAKFKQYASVAELHRLRKKPGRFSEVHSELYSYFASPGDLNHAHIVEW